MGNNCIGNANGENNNNLCRTESSQGTQRMQQYPNNKNVRKIFDDQLSSRRFTLQPSSMILDENNNNQRSCQTSKMNHGYPQDNFSSAASNHMNNNSIFQSNNQQRGNSSSCMPCNSVNVSPSPSQKRVSKIFNQSIQIKTPIRKQAMNANKRIDELNSTADKTNSNNNHFSNIEKAEWSLSPLISPRSKYFNKNANNQQQKQISYQGMKCDTSDVIDFTQQNEEEQFQQQQDYFNHQLNQSNNIFENNNHNNNHDDVDDLRINIDLEQFFQEQSNNNNNNNHQNKQNNNNNYNIKITELTIEDEEEDYNDKYIKNNNKQLDDKYYRQSGQLQTSLNYSESSICNISSLTPEQMMIVKSKYNQFDSSNSDKSTQINDNQSYNYTCAKILFSREQILSPQRLSTFRASDTIISETIKRNSIPQNVVIA